MDKNKCTSCGAAPKKCSCKNKEFTKAVVEINNPEETITLFRKVVIPASMGDDTAVPPVVGKYKNVLLFYEANSKSYLYSSDGIPTLLANGLTDYEQAVNLPEINGHVLRGNQSAADLGLLDASERGLYTEVVNALPATGSEFIMYLVPNDTPETEMHNSSGNPVVVTANSAIAHLQSFALDGNATQSSAPTPDIPVNVRVVTGTQTVRVNSNNYTLSLGAIELAKTGNRQDFLYKDSSGWKIQRGVGKVVLDGTETWTKTNVAFQTTADVTPNKGYTGTDCLSNYFRHHFYASGITTNIQNGEFGWNSSKVPTFRYDSCADATAFKSWLTAHNVTIYYNLENITTETITNSTLISQLEAIRTASLESGSNNISNVASSPNLAGAMTIEYLDADPQTLYKEYVWLEDEQRYELVGSTNYDLHEAIHTFDTVADMKAATDLIAGTYAQTLGNIYANDGGYAIFKIKSTGTPDNLNVYSVGNSLYAHRVFTDFITTGDEFAAAFSDNKSYASYECKSFRVDAPINLVGSLRASYKTFTNATITLGDDLFTWNTPSNYHAIPNFVNCTFIGNGHNIVCDNAYTLNGRFINCNFINCGVTNDGYLCQSMRFVNCRFVNSVSHPLIESKKVNDVHFINCQCESDNKSPLVSISNPDADAMSVYTLRFTDCILESQTSNIVSMCDGDVTFTNCYTELNSAHMVNVLPTQRASQPVIHVEWDNCRIQPSSGYYATYIDSSYEGSAWSSFECQNSEVRNGALLNTNNLHTVSITNTTVRDSGTILPSVESSKIGSSQNSVADFSTTGHCIVKKFPCLLTFDSSDGGWHTNLYFVSLSSSNTPQVQCLSDPNKTPTVTYDSGTGYCDVTLHTNKESDENCSAVLLNGLANNLVRNDYYRSTDGYTA